MRHLQNHIIQYVFILLTFALTVTALMTDISFYYKALFIVLSIFVYFFWSIWHHWESHKLTIAVVLEYILLIMILLWFLLNIAI